MTEAETRQRIYAMRIEPYHLYPHAAVDELFARIDALTAQIQQLKDKIKELEKNK